MYQICSVYYPEDTLKLLKKTLSANTWKDKDKVVQEGNIKSHYNVKFPSDVCNLRKTTGRLTRSAAGDAQNVLSAAG